MRYYGYIACFSNNQIAAQHTQKVAHTIDSDRALHATWCVIRVRMHARNVWLWSPTHRQCARVLFSHLIVQPLFIKNMYAHSYTQPNRTF